MKRTFLAKRNALLSSTRMSWGAIALVAAILLLLVRLVAPNFFWHALSPAFHASDLFAQGGHFLLGSFGDAASLTAQNEKLRSDNAALASLNESLRQTLASIAGLAPQPKDVVAGVVTHPPESPYDTLVLAAGSDDGIALGHEVFGEGNVPLGIISSVRADFSRATLFSSPGSSVLGWAGSARVPLILKGEGGGALSASVSRSAPIVEGDMVSVPGPGSIVIGTVVRVDSDPSSPSVTLRIQSALSPFSVTWVRVRDIGKSLQGAFGSSTPLVP